MYKSHKPSSSIFEIEQKETKIVNRFLNSVENRYYNNYCFNRSHLSRCGGLHFLTVTLKRHTCAYETRHCERHSLSKIETAENVY